MSSHLTPRGVPHNVNHWSRRAGVSLRPWSGRAPLGLIVRGVIQTGVCAVVVWFAWRLWRDDELGSAAELGDLRNVAIVIIVIVVLVGLLGLARIVVGGLDLTLRRMVTGRVVSVQERRLGDTLPHLVQQLIFQRRDSGMDRRRSRVEVVLNTPDGLRQWTIRNTRMRDRLQVDDHVQLRVSPIVGYVADVQPATR